MASSILQNYLNDTSIDQSKRKYLMDALNSGNIDEGTAEATIIKKYGNKYGEFSQDSFQEPQSAPINQDALNQQLRTSLKNSGKDLSDTGNFLGQAGGEVVKGLGNTVKFGGDLIQGAVDLAVPIPKGAPPPLFRYNDLANAVQGGLDASGNYIQDTSSNIFGKSKDDSSDLIGKMGGQIINAVIGGGLGAKAAQKALGTMPGIAKAAGKAVDTLIGNKPVQNAIKAIPSFLGGSLGSTAGASIPTQGRLPTGEELKTGLGTDILMSGLFQGLPNLARGIRKGVTKLREVRGKAAGLGDDIIEVLKDSKLGPKTLEDVKTAKAYIKNKAENLDPLMRVGEQELEPALLDLEKQRKTVGKKMSTLIKESKESDDLKKVYEKFKERVSNLGGEITKTGVKFSPYSEIDKTDAGILTDFLKKLTPKNPIKMEDVWGLNKQTKKILKSKTITKGNTLIPVSEPVSTVFKGLKTDLKKVVTDKIKEAGSLWDEYSKNVNTRAFFNKQLGEEKSNATLLNNLFSPAKKTGLVPKLTELSQKTGRDIIGPARAANAATQIVKKATAPIQNQGFIPRATDFVQKFILNPQKSAQKIVQSQKPFLPVNIGKAIQNNVSNALKGLFFFKK